VRRVEELDKEKDERQGDDASRDSRDKRNPFQEDLFVEEDANSLDTATPSKVPRNPFQKTFAPANSGHNWQEVKPNTRPASIANSRTSRLLDVDSFKTLLMTGSVEPTSPEPISKPPGDSSSGTETSSLSRQSIAESKDHALETPRSSYDTSRDDESFNQRPSQNQRSEKVKPPPPPPKSRHGRALPLKGPQTVSFDDFSPTIPAQMPQKARADISKPETDNISSNRPLPSPSSAASNPQLPETLSIPSKDLEGTSPTTLLSPQKKTAPPPPLARRSTVTKRPRTSTISSVTSQSDEQPSSYPPSIAESSTSQKMAPPPPPTRRTGSIANIVSPLTATTNLSSNLVANAQGRIRRTSQASLASPPTPPARRRSSRSSVDAAKGSASESRRTSNEMARTSIDSQRRVSVNEENDKFMVEKDKEQQKINPKTPSKPSTSDILADMEAFQKEIDELRARMT
jgi:hypothetical protein